MINDFGLPLALITVHLCVCGEDYGVVRICPGTGHVILLDLSRVFSRSLVIGFKYLNAYPFDLM
jgi:hypothetical protein